MNDSDLDITLAYKFRHYRYNYKASKDFPAAVELASRKVSQTPQRMVSLRNDPTHQTKGQQMTTPTSQPAGAAPQFSINQP
jgi:predicted alpha/beta hydrolase